MKTFVAFLLVIVAAPLFGKTYFNCSNNDLGIFIQHFPDDQSKLSMTVGGARIYPIQEGSPNVRVENTVFGDLVTVSYKKIISDPKSRLVGFLVPRIELKGHTSLTLKSVLLMGTADLNQPTELGSLVDIVCFAAYYE